MSSIDKLSILGIRSFDNQTSEHITFQTPLTLIVGLNGSGKTTIIECLKYATTGEMPPNSKGGAFIHDPNLCGEREVLAEVKVALRAVDGSRVVTSRRQMLTVKRGARSVKALETSVKVTANGESNTLSSRVADTNSLMTTYLGVSKAVLDNVIFCHQEDSLWPLSEPSKLKERFDKIFEALKYTKAIENIKVIQKNQKLELIKYVEQEKYTKQIKDRATKARKVMNVLAREVDEIKLQHEAYLVEEANANKEMEAASRRMGDANQMAGELRGLRIKRETKEESVNSLKENLQEMADSDQELQEMLEQYEERVQHYETDLEDQKRQYQQIGREVQPTRSAVSAKERECGNYEAQQDSHERQLQHRARLIKETARSHNIHGFDLDVDDAQAQTFMERISKMARDQNAAFERARKETQEELQRAQKVLNDIDRQKSSLNSRKDTTRQTIANNDRRIGSLQTELNSIDVDEGGKAAMESALQEVAGKLRTAKADMQQAQWESQVEKVEGELRSLDDRKDKLNVELVEGTRRAGDSARLDLVQKDLKDRQKSINILVGAHRDKISEVVGDAWSASDIEPKFQRKLDDSISRVADAERQRDGVSRENEQLEYQLKSCRGDIVAREQSLKAAVDAIRKAMDCPPEEYEVVIQDIERNLDICKTNVAGTQQLQQYFDAAIKLTQGKNKGCLMCCRGLRNDKETEVMLKNIERESNKLSVEDSAKDLEEWEKSLQEAKAVRSDYDTWEKLVNKELPKLKGQEEELKKKREAAIQDLEAKDAVVEECQAERRDIEANSRTVASIAKLHVEIGTLETQITELIEKQKDEGLSRGLEQIQDDIKAVNDETRAVKARLTKITADRERARALINRLELESRDVQSKLSNAHYQLEKKASLQEQVDDLKRANIQQRDAIKTLDQELGALGPQLSQAQAKYDEVARQGEERDRELQAATAKLNNSVNRLNNVKSEIDGYIARGGPQQLQRGRLEMEELKQQVANLEREQGLIVREVKTLEDQLRNHAETKRSIADNQRYRRDVRDLQQVREEVRRLEATNVEEELDKHQREHDRWRKELNKITLNATSALTQLKSHDQQLDTLTQDYNTEHKDAAKNYKEAHIRLETTKACVEDLGRYGGALDKAIMKYHSLKMEEINRIVDELWRKTYQGTDVDTILIRSESETSKSNKNYNYRVCMVKQDAEMDMRGRCSAGQKVLASIIIRLALAECFGVNCGLIALDEPTTNLDRENIRALAESLAEIIKVRRAQKNFQLIVITHDEDFLRFMGASDFADTYVRVSRTTQQKSKLRQQDLSRVL